MNDKKSFVADAERRCCSGCHLVLHPPYVECTECRDAVVLCLDCLAKGVRFDSHEESHGYRMAGVRFSVLADGWSAEEELALLDAVLQRGLGDWDAAAAAIASDKSPEECRRHFDEIYVENQSGLLEDDWKNTRPGKRNDRPVMISARPSMDFPPRPAHNSPAYRDLGGYNTARSDFDLEPDPTAEFMVASIQEKESDDLDRSLHVAAVEAYNNRLRERSRTKGVVRELSLLNKSRTLGQSLSLNQLSNVGGAEFSRLHRFARLMCAFDFDSLVESLRHEIGLRQRLLRLQDARRNGVTKLSATALFAKLRQRRLRLMREVPTESIQDVIASNSNGANCRRTAAPLDLLGLPAAERLSSPEKKVCSEARIYPEAFLSAKSSLIGECVKNGGLKLAEARPLIKMDVNKTRKVYDFLLKTGQVWKPKMSA